MSTQVQLLPPGPLVLAFAELWRGSSVGRYERLINAGANPMEITNLSAEPLGKLHSWLPHDLQAEQVVFLPDACPGKSPLPTGTLSSLGSRTGASSPCPTVDAG